MKIKVFMIGARRDYLVPVIFARNGLLSTFYTDIFFNNSSFLRNFFLKIAKFFKLKPLVRMLLRTHPELKRDEVYSSNIKGSYFAFLWSRSPNKNIDASILGVKQSKWFNRKISRYLYEDSTEIYYGICGQSYEIFNNNKKAIKILDQAILPRQLENRLMSFERKRWPSWEDNSAFIESSKDDDLSIRERAEWELSDYILCGSKFVASGLRALGVSPEKIKIISTGASMKNFTFNPKSLVNKKKLNVAFIGEIGIRKGIPYLLHAIQKFDKKFVNLRLYGTINIPSKQINTFSNYFEYMGQIPRNRIHEAYNWADILILPSIVEGSALVTYEAILSGCPVVATRNSGFNVIENNNGLLIESSSSESIAEAIEKYLLNLNLLQEQNLFIKDTRFEYSDKRYEKDIVNFIKTIRK